MYGRQLGSYPETGDGRRSRSYHVIGSNRKVECGHFLWVRIALPTLPSAFQRQFGEICSLWDIPQRRDAEAGTVGTA